MGSAYSNSNNPPQIFAGLPNCLSTSGSTIPWHTLHLPASWSCSHLSWWKFFLLELTILFESNLEAAHSHKSDRYASLISNLSSFSLYLPKLFTIEVGSRGFVSKSNVLLPSFLQSHLSIPNAFALTFPTLLPSVLTLIMLSDAPLLDFTATSCHAFLLLIQIIFFFWQDPLGRGSLPFFSLPLFPFLVGYPFLGIFRLLSFFIIVQQARQLAGGRRCSQ